MIVTIDGPAGAGKSTVARALAGRLGFRFLDTGAMYRAVAWAAQRRKLELNDPSQMAKVAREMGIELVDDRVLVDGEDVTREIRTATITAITHFAASNPDVREHLVALQRQIAGADNVVTEGRDQGTVAFPNAECKIFLTASPQERAKRRAEDLAARGEKFSFEQVLADQIERDDRDSTRAVGPLAPASDAIEIRTDGLSPGQVLDRLEQLVRETTPGGRAVKQTGP